MLGDFVHQREVSPTIDRSYDDLCEELRGMQNQYVSLGDAKSGNTRRLMANPSSLDLCSAVVDLIPENRPMNSPGFPDRVDGVCDSPVNLRTNSRDKVRTTKTPLRLSRAARDIS